MRKVAQLSVKKRMKVNELIRDMGKVGVLGSGKMSQAVDIIEEMIKDKDCTVFLGAAGALVPGGMKNVLIELVKHSDVFVTTGAMLTHDLIESLGYNHYQGNPHMNDSALNKKGLVRMYDSLMPTKAYQNMEDFFEKNIKSLASAQSIKEFLWQLGKVAKKGSILDACYRHKVPLFCPALADSGIGLMMYNYMARNNTVETRAFEDLKDIMEITWTMKRAGVIYLGGGVPKNYIQQALQLGNPAHYGVQITTDRPEPGGSSGAALQEGVSWHKMEAQGKFVDVFSDITIALPLIVAALNDRL